MAKYRTVGGVKVLPKWDWSEAYAADVRRHAREMAKSNYDYMSAKQVEKVMKQKYQDWLVERDAAADKTQAA